MLCWALAALWLMQQPIEVYYQQTRHSHYPLADLNRYPPWKWGENLWSTLTGAVDAASQSLETGSQRLTDGVNREFVLTDSFYQREREAKARQEALEATQRQAQQQPQPGHPAQTQTQGLAQTQAQTQTQQQALPPSSAPQVAQQTTQATPLAPAPVSQPLAPDQISAYLTLAPPGKVFLAGDSLMQGIAPWLLRKLKKLHDIDGVDLSKQSTGLAYPQAFNWPQTIASTIAADPDIRLLIIMLGPNDGWDMPESSRKGGRFLRFKTPEWEATYRQRVAGIIQANAASGVKTLWVGAPGMASTKLNDQMAWLMAIIQDEVQKQGAVFLDTRSLLQGADGVYSDSMKLDGEITKVRTGDGIHFSPSGQKYLAQQILDKLNLPAPPPPQ